LAFFTVVQSKSDIVNWC